MDKLLPIITVAMLFAFDGIYLAVAMAATPAMNSQGSPRRPSKEEVEEPEILDLISRVLPRLRGAAPRNGELVVSEFRQGLMLAISKARKLPRMERSRELSRELIGFYDASSKGQSLSPGGRKDVIQTLALYGDDVVAKEFILGILDKGSEDERQSALAVVGLLAISGDDVYAMVERLAERNQINPKRKSSFLVRINKDRALPGILNEVGTSKDRETFLYAAWALQDYYRRPEDYKLILPRIQEVGLGTPNSFDRTDGLFWMAADLFASYIDGARGDDLKAALAFMEKFDSVRNSDSAPVIIRKLKDPDPDVRAAAARLLGPLYDYRRSDKRGIRQALEQAMSVERVETVTREIRGTFNRIDFLDENERNERGRSR